VLKEILEHREPQVPKVQPGHRVLREIPALKGQRAIQEPKVPKETLAVKVLLVLREPKEIQAHRVQPGHSAEIPLPSLLMTMGWHLQALIK
jgi:hypothetical protein